MHSFMDSKLMAKLLRQALAERSIDVSHSDCLELVARQFGLANWNILSAKIEAATTDKLQLPEGWRIDGRSPAYYNAGLDPAHPGTVLIESRSELQTEVRSDDFCTVMQSVDAKVFRGKRMRLSGDLRTEAVTTGATLWFRVDGRAGTLQFDNLEQRQKDGPLVDTTNWTERDVIFDIPEEATSLHYGFFLKGTGRCWSRRFSLETADARAEVSANRAGILPKPKNLDFGQASRN